MKRKVLYGVIFLICIIAINYSIYWQFFRKEKTEEPGTSTTVVEEGEILKDFNSIFKNTIDYQNYNIQGLQKNDNSKDMIYTGYTKQENKENSYELDVNLPVININSTEALNINKEIEMVFGTPAQAILAGTLRKTIYTVDYQAYINSNILSLVIKSTYKDGDSPQRVIVSTYTYNLSTNEKLNLSQVLEIKGLNRDSVTQEIRNKITEAIEQSKKLQELGYTIYERNIEDNKYRIENTTEFFLGKDNSLYIVYPYGNSNDTSEMDIIVFK